MSAFSCVMNPQSKATIGVVLYLSSSLPQFNTMLSTVSSGLDAAHQFLKKKKKQNLHVFVSRLVGFSGYILALGTSASSGCSSSSFPISTSSRGALIGSMSSPIVARFVFRVFVGPTSALLCHTRVPLLRIVHNIGFCGLHFFPQREIEDVVFDVDCTELFSSVPTHQSFEMHPHFMDNFAVHWNHETTAGS